jgi:hypothetical protein
MGIFKLVFRTISVIMFLILLIVAVAVWKGGEPFRWVGEGTVIIGQTISKLADTIDEIKNSGEKIGEQITEMKETLDALKGKDKEPEKPGHIEEDEPLKKNGNADQDKEPG